jgi:Relaxase/Mobilisation nuclease domain.
MISKVAKSRTQAKSSARRLVNYLTNTKNIADRVLATKTTNCYNDDLHTAVLEMELTQEQNYRSSQDKTYHLVLSFSQNDKVTPEILEAVESEVADRLGYKEHQRMSVLHGDTDNLHLHLVINKVHPKTHTIWWPKQDFAIVREACLELEKKYSLQHEGIDTQRSPDDVEAKDIEVKTGEQTLTSWVRENCTDSIQKAKSWQELHRNLEEFSLEIKVRGNGLVIANRDDGKYIKMSSVSRELSKGKLENRFGKYEEKIIQNIDQNTRQNNDKKRFTNKPCIKINESLFDQYMREKNEAKYKRKNDYEKINELKNELLNRAKNEAKKHIETSIDSRIIRLLLGRKSIEKMIRNEYKKRAKNVYEIIKEERLNIRNRSKNGAFNDWLRAKAATGNEAALDALRKNARRIVAKNNTISGRNEGRKNPFVAVDIEGVTNEGTVLYRIDNRTVKDDGKNLILREDASDKAIATSLKLAQSRHGDYLVLTGTTSFRERVFAVLKSENLKIKLEDRTQKRGQAM